MTEKQANKIFQEKYPTGYICYKNIGRKNHSNIHIAVSFAKTGKTYRYAGDYESVLIKLGLMNSTKKYDILKNDPAKNIFLIALKQRS